MTRSSRAPRTIFLLDNYRSTPEILAAANSLIAKNRNRIPKELRPTRPSGPPVLCQFAESQEQEAPVDGRGDEGPHSQGVPYRDMTVLYRAHYVTRTVEQVLLEEKLPYTIYSGVQFFQRAEIKDALSYLRMIVYRDDLSFRRVANVPKRNLGKRRMAFLDEYAQKHGCTLYQALTDSLEDPIFKGTKASAFVSLWSSSPLDMKTGPSPRCSPPCSTRAAMRPCSAPRAARSGWTTWRS